MPAMKTSLVSLVGLIAFSCIASAQTDRSRATKIKPTAERSSGISAPEPWRRPGHGKPNARLRAQSAVAAGMNANTVTVVAGTPGGTYYRAASDLAFVLDDERLRVLAVLGKGAGQNVYDIRFLRGVDLGFVRLDTLEQLRADKRIIDPERNITYVARLFNDEMHVIAARDITDIRQLAGKRVSFDVTGSGTDYTGRSMFKGLGIEVQIVNLDQPTALDLLKRGELAAVVSVAAKPVEVVSNFQGGDRFHLLPVPYVEALSDKYFPATLRHEDYPRLVPTGNTKTHSRLGRSWGPSTGLKRATVTSALPGLSRRFSRNSTTSWPQVGTQNGAKLISLLRCRVGKGSLRRRRGSTAVWTSLLRPEVSRACSRDLSIGFANAPISKIRPRSNCRAIGRG